MADKKAILHPESFAIVKTKYIPTVEFFAFIKCDEEITAVIPEKELANLDNVIECEKGFRLLTFDMTLPFDTVGFISRISSALANAKIPILVFSSYSTDHILVRENYVERAVDVLENLGFVVRGTS